MASGSVENALAVEDPASFLLASLSYSEAVEKKSKSDERTVKKLLPFHERKKQNGPSGLLAKTGRPVPCFEIPCRLGENGSYLRKRLSQRTASQVPTLWNTCTRITSRAVATTMIRYLYR